MPAMLPGARGFGVPASGGSRRRFAITGTPPSVPWIVPLPPGVAVPVNFAVLPFTQLTAPLSLRGALPLPPSSRSFAPSVFCVFEKLTNSPDCFTSNDGPGTGGWVGADGGSGAPVGFGGGAPRQATGPAAS
jgi:hypothetical protein